jgi:hypothetical protein
MESKNDEKVKKPASKVAGVIIFLIVAAIFVGPRVMREHGVPSAATMSGVEVVREKIGADRFENLMKATLPAGYAALCVKEHGENPALMAAAQSYNVRNQEKMTIMLQSLEASGGLTASEKEAVDKYAYSRVMGDINNGHVSCDTVADRINGGEWDF